MRTTTAACVAAILLLLSACSAGPSARVVPRIPEPGSTLRGVVDGQRVRLDVATTEHTLGVAVWFHGQRGDVDSFMGSGWLDSLRAQGWDIASSDLHGAAWGDPQAVQDVPELVRWATARAHADVRLLIAGSMGGLTSLNAMLAGVVQAPCWFGTEAVVDIDSVSAVPGSTAEIQDVYGGPVPDRSNPVTRLDELPLTTRYFVVASPEDTWVPPSANTDLLVSALRARGAVVGTAASSGPHGDPSHYRTADLDGFAAQCSGR